MKNFVKRFKEDPDFALMVIISAVCVAALTITASAKLIDSSAYAYRASKLK